MPFYAHNAIIPMLHRVGVRDHSRITANQNMVVNSIDLYDFILSARNQGWNFISLDELVEVLRQKKSNKKVLSLTFDDGYLDNYQQAFPILCELNVPFCVYITSGFLGDKIIPWWYLLEHVLSLGSEFVDLDGKLYNTETLEEQNIAFMSIRNILMGSFYQYQRYTSWLDKFSVGFMSGNSGRLFMSWQELQKLSESDLVTIGAHTLTHPVLAIIDDTNAYNEIKLSRDILSSKLNKEIKHFAFPFGGQSEVSDRDICFAERIGFSTAVTTNHGGINTGKNIDHFSMPRLFFGPDFHLHSIQLRLLKHEAKQAIKKLLP